MTDLLTPAEVREGLALSKGISSEHAISSDKFQRLCRDYLTLWDELEHERKLHDKAVRRVTQLEQEIGALMQ